MIARIARIAWMAWLAGLVGWLMVWPASASALPALPWPPGTQVQPLAMTWFGAPLEVRVATIPLPVAQAMDALIAAADAPWQATVAGGRVVLAPLDDAWRLALTAAGEHTVATLSRLPLTQARSPSVPSWLGMGWTLRAAVGVSPHSEASTVGPVATAVVEQRQQHWVLTHASPPSQLRSRVDAGLQRAGWWQAERLSDAVSHWRRGVQQMRLVMVPVDGGTGLSIQAFGDPP